jgi:hypothetical protein
MNLVDIIKGIRYQQVMMNSTNIQSESRRLKIAHTFQSVIDLEEDENMMQPIANKRMMVSYDPEEIEPNIEY